MSTVDDIIKQLDKVIKNRGFLNEVGAKIVFIYTGAARSGKNVNGTPFVYSDPAEAAKRKKYIARNNGKHRAFRASIANLTITGELIDSIKHIVGFDGLISIRPVGIHSAYKGNKGQYISKAISNKKIFSYLESKFPVLQDSEFIRNKITKLAKEELRRRLKNKIA